jgi:hypothetical protein
MGELEKRDFSSLLALAWNGWRVATLSSIRLQLASALTRYIVHRFIHLASNPRNLKTAHHHRHYLYNTQSRELFPSC